MKFRSICLLCGTALCLATATLAVPRPGLREYKLGGGKFSFDNPRPDLFFQTAGRIVNAPYAVNVYKDWSAAWNANPQLLGQYTNPAWWPPNTATEVSATYGDWGWSDTFVYAGFIHIPAESNAVALAISFNGAKRILIDDVPFCESQDWGASPVANMKTLDPGPHKFELWIDNNMNECGPFAPGPWFHGDKEQWHPDRIGLGVNWTGDGDTTKTENYTFPIDPGDGSLFTADPPPGYLRLKTIAADNVTGNSAALSGYIILGEEHPGVARVYCGAVDHGDDAGLWGDNFTEHAAVVDAGATFEHTVTIPVTGLIAGQEYHFRFAFTNDLGLFMAPNSLAFTPEDFNKPARFGWGSGRAAAYDWDDPAGWVNMDGLARQIPGASVGDTLHFTETPAGNRTVQVTHDATIAGITAGFGSGSYQLAFTPGAIETPATLHLQTPAATPFAVNNIGIGGISFGPGSAATRDLLAFELHQSVAFNLNSSINGYLYLNSPFTGGVAGGTFGFYHNQTASWSQYVIFVRNPANTFIGDIIINRPESIYRPLKIYFGDNTSNTAADGMFGDSGNRLVSQHPGNSVTIHTSSAGFLFNRALVGLGLFRFVSMQNTDGPLDYPRDLTFGPAARVEPGIGEAPGALTILASNVAFDPASTLRIRVWPDGTCDVLTLQIRGNRVSESWNGNPPNDPTPGSLNLLGNLEFEEMGGVSRSGVSWDFGVFPYTNTVVNFSPASHTPHFSVRVVRNEENNTLRLTAVKNNTGSILLLR